MEEILSVPKTKVLKNFESQNGLTYGKLTIISEAESLKNKKGYRVRRVNVSCVCGVKKEVALSSLRQGVTTSCGCYNRENLSTIKKTHGGRRLKIYSVYIKIKQRCENKNNKDYKNYGGRGIVCEWNSFESFRDDMEEGYSEILTIERNDVNGNYCKSNCRWATRLEQSKNKTNTVWYKGLCLSDYCKENNINYKSVSTRINSMRWSVEDAINVPIKKAIMHNGVSMYEYCRQNKISYSNAMRKLKNGISI